MEWGWQPQLYRKIKRGQWNCETSVSETMGCAMSK